jgi:fatty-acyl-CoA synthase
MVGAKLVFPRMCTAEKLDIPLDLMVAEKVTINEGAPAIFLPMLDYLRSLPEKPHSENLRMISGATEPPLAMTQGYAEFGAEIIHAYGATEMGPLVTCNVTKPSLSGLSEEQRWEQKKQQGLPLCGLEVKIVDGEGRELGPGSGESGKGIPAAGRRTRSPSPFAGEERD